MYLATADHTDSMPLLRELFSIMQEEQEMRMQIYQMMHQRGWYSPKMIEETQLQQAKNQFSSVRGRLQQQTQQLQQQQGWPTAPTGPSEWQQQGWQQGASIAQQGHSACPGDQQRHPQQQHPPHPQQPHQHEHQRHWSTPRSQSPQGSAYNPS